MRGEVRWLITLSVCISVFLSIARTIIPFKVIPYYATTLMKITNIFNVATLFLALIIFLGLYFEIKNKRKPARLMLFILLGVPLGIYFFGLVFLDSTSWGWLGIFAILEIIGFGGILGFFILLILQYFIRKFLVDEEKRRKMYKVLVVVISLLILTGLVIILIGPNDEEYYDNEFRDIYHQEIYPSGNPELIFAACQELEKRNISVWRDKDCYNRYGEVGNDPKYCKEAWCIVEVARKTKNPQLCFDYKLIFNESANGDTFFDICLIESIAETQNVNNCVFIEDKIKEVKCILTMNTINNNDLNECEGYGYYVYPEPQYCDSGTAKYQMAINNLNVSMCFDIILGKIECAAQIANITQNISYCEFSHLPNLESWENKQLYSEECISKVASMWKDPKLCDKIRPDSEFYRKCLFNTYSSLEEAINQSSL